MEAEPSGPEICGRWLEENRCGGSPPHFLHASLVEVSPPFAPPQRCRVLTSRRRCPEASTTASTAPANFALIREESAPYSQHFLQNAAQLADNLEWYTSNVDADVGRQLKAEIVEFAAQYRRDGYTPYGPMPGLPDLQTAYDALSAHFARYQSTPSGFATPLPEALVGSDRTERRERAKEWQLKAAVAASRRMPHTHHSACAGMLLATYSRARWRRRRTEGAVGRPVESWTSALGLDRREGLVFV